MKKAYLVTFHVTTRVVTEEVDDEDRLIDILSKKGRERVLKQPADYLMGDNLDYEPDEEIPFGEDPEDEQELSARDQIRNYLAENGMAERIGKVYHCCSHRCGIPSHEVIIKPDGSPIDGAHAIVITTTHVMSATCSIPFNHHNWHIRHQVEYDNKERMLELVKNLAIKKEGCW